MNQVRALIIDEDAEFSYTLKKLLEEDGVEAEIARSRATAMETLLYSPFDVLLLDLTLGSGAGLEILRELNAAGSALPIITMTAHGSIETAVEAMHLNAFDYITKPLGKAEILEIIRRAVDFSRADSSGSYQDTTGRTVPVMGQSTVMIEIYKEIGRVAPTDTPVFISGESGSGHDVVAKAIHDHSRRTGHPFITVQCSGTETELNKELFQAGGAFQRASGGTLFLDEIHSLSPALQTQLWRLLQIRSFVPENRGETVEVRLLASSQRTMEALLASGFRKDLLSRIAGVGFHLPPLRQRANDIPLLAAHFVRKHARRLKKSIVLSPETAEWLKKFPWTGNIRELDSTMERAVTLNTTGEIRNSDFPYLEPFSPTTELVATLERLRTVAPSTPEIQELINSALELARALEKKASS